MHQSVSSYQTTPPLQLRIWLESAAFMRMLAGTIWVTSWYQRLLLHQVPWLAAFAILFVLLAVSFNLVRLLNRLDWNAPRVRIAAAVWLILALVTATRLLLPDGTPANQSISGASAESGDGVVLFVHLLILLLIIGRGYWMANAPLDTGNTLRDFQIGVFFFLLYGTTFRQAALVEILAPIYAFLLLNLMSLALARVADLSYQRGGRLPSSLLSWSRPIILSALSVVTISLVFAWLVSQQIGTLTVIVTAVVLAVLFLIAAVASLPILAILYYILPWLQRLLGEGLAEIPIQNPIDLANDMFREDLDKLAQANAGMDSTYLILLGLILLVIALIFILGIDRRSRSQRYAATLDQTEALTPTHTGDPRPDSDNFFRRRSQHASRIIAAAQIRRIYAQLEDLSKRLGYPRPAAATPLEFQRVLRQAFPGEEPDLSLITSAYLRVRYGELPESEEEIRAVKSAWETLKKQGAHQLGLLRQEKRRQARQK